MSVAAGAAKVTTAPAGPVASTVLLPGTPLIAGGVVSTTVIVNVLVTVLPAVSTAVQVTSVAPSAKVSPEAWSQVSTGAESTLSTALAAKVAAAPLGPVASTIMSGGTVRVGAVPSYR